MANDGPFEKVTPLLSGTYAGVDWAVVELALSIHNFLRIENGESPLPSVKVDVLRQIYIGSDIDLIKLADYLLDRF